MSCASRLHRCGSHPNVARLLALCARDEPLCLLTDLPGEDDTDLVAFLGRRRRADKAAAEVDEDDDEEGHYSNLLGEQGTTDNADKKENIRYSIV